MKHNAGQWQEIRVVTGEGRAAESNNRAPTSSSSGCSPRAIPGCAGGIEKAARSCCS